MLDHLDDPQGFTPDDDFRAAVVRRGRGRRRRHRLVGATGAGLVLVVVAAGAALARVDHQLDKVDRVEVAALRREEPAPAEPYTVVIVGSDSRAGSGDPADREVVGARSDTVILARVHPDDRVTVLPLPRDLWVDLPGHGAGRINSAFALGGPSLLLATIEEDLGIAVDRYVELDFRGTQAIGDAIGGLRLSFPSAVRDQQSGLSLDAGCQALDGTAILALARARHLQSDEGGRWRSDPTSDLGRIERQQAIGVAALGALSHLDTGSPRQLDELLGVIAQHLTVDARTSNKELIGLFRGIAGSRIDQLRLPVADANRGGAQVLEATPEAGAVIAGFEADSPAPSTTTAPGSPTTPSTSTTPSSTTVPGAPSPFVPTPC